MTGIFIKIKKQLDPHEHSTRVDNFTPKLSKADGHVACEFENEEVHISFDLNWSDVACILSLAFPDYLPTMDAAHRFMKSNPKTSREMLDEIEKAL